MSSDVQAWQELDKGLQEMLDHFSNLIKASRIPGEESESEKRAPGDMLEIWAEKLVHSAHHCLSKTSQLKRGAVISGFQQLITNVRDLKTNLDTETVLVNRKLATIKTEAHALLLELEDSYYGSQYRGKLVAPGTSEKLQELNALALELSNN